MGDSLGEAASPSGAALGYAAPVADDKTEFNIQVPPECQAGVWANFAVVSHSQYEFTLDFVRLSFGGPQAGSGIVVSKVNMSPLFVDQLITALQENQARWVKAQAEEAEVKFNEGE